MEIGSPRPAGESGNAGGWLWMASGILEGSGVLWVSGDKSGAPVRGLLSLKLVVGLVFFEF